MSMVRISSLILLAILLLSLACRGASHAGEPTPTAAGKIISLKVELADTGEKFLRGLRERSSLEGGILFDFERSVSVPFGMKDTLIPLSIAFVSGSKEIVDIQAMKPLSEEVYFPAKPYRYALEVNRGYFEENDISVGDRIELEPSDSAGYLIVIFYRCKFGAP